MRSQQLGVILVTLLFAGSIHAMPISMVLPEKEVACKNGSCKKNGNTNDLSGVISPASQVPVTASSQKKQSKDSQSKKTKVGETKTPNDGDKKAVPKKEVIKELTDDIVKKVPDSFPDDDDHYGGGDDKQVAVPEPGTFALFGTGLLALLLLRRRG